MKKRMVILCGFAGLLLVASLYYNFAGGDTAEGGGPCFGIGSLMLIVLLLCNAIADWHAWRRQRRLAQRGFEPIIRVDSSHTDPRR